ncbi:MAG: hypothetical protein JST36_04825 [Bacteroidetes bacterium]|nr:hypothetical protein [Bacteroidota bacterium]
MKHFLLLSFILLLGFQSKADSNTDPSHWDISAVKIEKGLYRIEFKVSVDRPWYIPVLNPNGDGTVVGPTFNFKKGAYTLFEGVGEQGIATQTKLGGDSQPIYFYPSGAMFTQSVRAKRGTVITGTYTYQIIGNTSHKPLKTSSFKVKLP